VRKIKRVYVAGHNGMVGTAIVRSLVARPDIELVLRSREELDLLDAQAVHRFFKDENIQEVYIAAAKVGGIYANGSYPAEFIYENLMLACNLIHASHLAGIKKLLFMGSSCIYPKYSVQPILESMLLTSTLEPINEPYAIAKIAGIKLCESYNHQYGCDYRTIMPTNLYGPNDNFDIENGHVVPALMRRFHEAKMNGDATMVVWGSGEPRREFLYVDDLAEASIHVMDLDSNVIKLHTQPMSSHINIGTGVDCSIGELAELVASVVGFEGVIRFDDSKPDGAPQKLLDVELSKSLGWEYSIPLKQGLELTYAWFLNHQNELRGQ